MFKRALLFVVVCAFVISNAAAQSKFDYPNARKGDQVDDYNGVKVADPYRWMEDTESAETKAWIEAENRLTNSYL